MNVEKKIPYQFPVEFIETMEKIRKMSPNGYGAIDYNANRKKITVGLIFKEEDCQVYESN